MNFTNSTASTLRSSHRCIMFWSHFPFSLKKMFAVVINILSGIFSFFSFLVTSLPCFIRYCVGIPIVFFDVNILTGLAQPIKLLLHPIPKVKCSTRFYFLALWALFCHLSLVACDSVPIKDEIFYGNKGMHGAVEFHTLTSGQREIKFEDWMQLLKSKPLVCSSVETFGDYKAAIEKLCSVCNCCSYEAKAQLAQFFTNIQKATGGFNATKPNAHSGPVAPLPNPAK